VLSKGVLTVAGTPPLREARGISPEAAKRLYGANKSLVRRVGKQGVHTLNLHCLAKLIHRRYYGVIKYFVPLKALDIICTLCYNKRVKRMASYIMCISFGKWIVCKRQRGSEYDRRTCKLLAWPRLPDQEVDD